MMYLLTRVEIVLWATASFNLGLMIPVLRTWWYRRRMRRMRAARTGPITKDDIREELGRDPVAMNLFMSDHTPSDVQRYLYLEAERRAIMRRSRQLAENESDFFAPPRRGGDDPGFSGCRR